MKSLGDISFDPPDVWGWIPAHADKFWLSKFFFFGWISTIV